MSSEPFLDGAVAIGRRIVADAVWCDGRCSWMGAVTDPGDAAQPEFRPVGPRLYDGTAGIGLFLAQLAATTGEASFRRTAGGALRHAVERSAALAPRDRDGLHSGTLGVAWAAASASTLLADDEHRAGARAVLDHAAPPEGDARSPDLELGAAGAILALLALARMLDEPDFLRRARETGDALLSAGTVTRRGWSWADPKRPGPRHLCGLAHGASGIASALLELSVITGAERFRSAAAGGFDYERSWLDERSSGWPDLRVGFPRAGMTATWCYGEAGIALSRLRASEILGDGPHRLDADIALAITRRHLESHLPYAFDDLSLCHGLGGAAVALLAAGRADAARALAHTALERHGARGDWPCGPVGMTPSLFDGLSGIGWMLLCLHDPHVPSPLAVPSVG
jgi:lantibiotic modifying enzyme